MATRRQNIKDIQNKQSQAREQYAKNRSLLGEFQVKEKATDQKRPNHLEAPKNPEAEE
ncbi:MAG: hypothetical protein LUE98_18570 [Tannerellaceae bacterium]|nr:hypothetical protein [Tannerellaceae bacterium]